ncbi:purple acid phosphatase family protein [Treponema sp. R6D11]
MLFKKLKETKKSKKQSVLQLTALFLAAVFAIVMVACNGLEVEGTNATAGQSGAVTKTPVFDDYDISNNLIQTVGHVTAVTVTKKDNTRSPGAVTVYYTGIGDTDYDKTQDLPEELGSYAVTFDVAPATGWNGAPGFSAGTLVIGEPIPQATDFEFLNSNQVSDDLKVVEIVPRDGKSTGDITIYYRGINGTNYPISTVRPTAEGTYEVTFDVAESDGWKEATGLIAGNLNIGNPNYSSPVLGDYNISNNFNQTVGNTTPVIVEKKDNDRSPGAVTVYYTGTDGTNYDKSQTPPTAAGTYRVTFDVAKVTGANGWNAGEFEVETILTIKGIPVKDDFNISDNFEQSEGSVTKITVTPRDGKSQGTVTVYYNGSDVLPTTMGTYIVTFHVAASGVWNEATISSVGTLTIKKFPVALDYDISDNFIQTVGNTTPVIVEKKDANKSPGAVTVYYQGSGSTNYPKSDIFPTAVGTYSVTFDVAASGLWNAQNELTAGILIISPANEIAKNYTSGPDGVIWGNSATNPPLTLGLTPGDTTRDLNLNWNSSTSANRTAKVRFVKGTFTAGYDFIEVTGTATGTASPYVHKVTVTNYFIPGESYQYSVSSDGNNWSYPYYNFNVPAATGTFKFAVITDPQLNTSWDQFNRYSPTGGNTPAAGWKQAVEKVVAAGASFIASCGDQVDTAGDNTQYTNLFAPDGIKSLPFAPSIGNHDTDQVGNNVTFWNRYNLPNEQSFSGNKGLVGGNYFYLYNNILFVVLNTAPYPVAYNNATSSAAAAQPYVERYNQTITAAKTAHAGKYDWLIVQHHKSTASVAVHLADRDIQSYVEAGFETIMSEQGVDFVIAGHDHVYARSYPLQGKDNGKVSVPDKTKGGNIVHNPGNPIYFTFTTASGLKYYAVAADLYFSYNTSGVTKIYVTNNTQYPYLGDVTDVNGTSSTLKGSSDWVNGNLPVSNLTYTQPYIPSYTIVEVNGKSITFKTYPIGTKSGQNGSSTPYSFDETIPYDQLTVTKD